VWPHSSLLLFPTVLVPFYGSFVWWFAVLHAGSRVTCHSFLNLRLYFSKFSRPGMSLLRSEGVILLVDSLYAEAIETVKLQAALSASYSELICILGEINSEAKLWNRSQSVNLSIGSERFLVQIWSSKWKTIGRRSETMTSDSRTFLCTTIPSTSTFPVGQ
jgi:hypothetical protein